MIIMAKMLPIAKIVNGNTTFSNLIEAADSPSVI